MNFNISYGASNNIPAKKTAGNVYVTNDTSEMFVDLSAETRIQIGDLYVVDTIPPTPLLLNKFYYNQTDSKLYFYNGTWRILNEVVLTSEDITKVLKLGGGIVLDKNLALSVDSVDVVELGNMKPVTSNAVKKAFNETAVKVDVVDKAEAGNMNPISSNAVFTAIGNIETALAAI